MIQGRKDGAVARRVLTVTALLAIIFACHQPAGTEAPEPSAHRRVLFIGNSYLYWKDVPGIVEALANAHGDEMTVESVAFPDMALIDHWRDGTARRVIESSDWDYVVLQQGPSSVEVNRDSLRLLTVAFAELIVEAHGRPALFSAWPAASRRQDFDRAIESYRIAATDVNGVFLPVASSWLETWVRDPGIELYEDNLHPTEEGAYLSALVVYARLSGRSPVGMPHELGWPRGGALQINPEIARTLQEAAEAALNANAAPGALRR